MATGSVDLEQYHAMSVTEWLDVETGSGARLRLLRIRNPWGRRGTWMKGEACWSSVDPVLSGELQGRLEAGEFWVDEAEFISQFDDVTVGYPITEDGHLKSIFTGNVLAHSHQLMGRWTRGLTAGGCRNCISYSSNPKFWLKVSERGEVLVSLHQQGTCRGNTERYAHTPLEGGQNTQHQHYQAIALHMWKVEKKRFNLARVLNKAPSASTHCHAYEREVVLHAHLEPGHYLLIPSTFLAGARSSFLIRASSSHPVSLRKVVKSHELLGNTIQEGVQDRLMVLYPQDVLLLSVDNNRIYITYEGRLARRTVQVVDRSVITGRLEFELKGELVEPLQMSCTCLQDFHTWLFHLKQPKKANPEWGRYKGPVPRHEKKCQEVMIKADHRCHPNGNPVDNSVHSSRVF